MLSFVRVHICTRVGESADFVFDVAGRNGGNGGGAGDKEMNLHHHHYADHIQLKESSSLFVRLD